MSCAIHPLEVWGLLASMLVGATAIGQSPHAIEVVEYVPGAGVSAGYDVPETALGEPSRFTADPLFPSAVTPFSSPYLPTQICSIGGGGRLVLAFDHPVADDPANPFGIDLLVFGNAFFIDAAYPAGIVGGVFSDGGLVEVSPDGVDWFPLPDAVADGLFPTLGFQDLGPYPTEPGNEPTDFTRPVDPLLGPMLIGMAFHEVVEAYAGSGGGAGIDLATAGVAEARFVRLSVPKNAGITIEIDAVSDVTPDSVSPDLDGDGTVGGSDLTILLASWGEGDADLDGSGVVDGSDLTMLLAAWGAQP